MKTLEDIRGKCVITEDGHWLWRGSLRPDGRANIWAPDYTKGGHHTVQCGTRAVWHCQHGKALPAGWRVWGTCEEQACCNPRHIRAGTEAEFGQWLVETGRFKGQTARILANRATGRKRSVFTPETIAYIQGSEKSGVELAEELQISRASISKARRGELVVFQSGGMFSGLLNQRRAA